MKTEFTRLCDMCGEPYEINNKEIPRVIVYQKKDIDDLTTKDFFAMPDYCDLCIRVIIRLLQRKRNLKFSIHTPRYIPNVEDNISDMR